MSSNVDSSSIPALAGAELAQGILGSSLFGGLPAVTGSALSSGPGSSNPQLTLGDAEVDLDAVKVTNLEHIRGDLYGLTVWSPSMKKDVYNHFLLPGGPDNTTPLPSLYLMMGANGNREAAWAEGTNYMDFFKDKNVNVVSPFDSKSSMQTDWYYSDPNLKDNRWATYMIYELPHIMDTQFHGTGNDGIAGISMSGGPALNLASHSDRLKAAGSFSGCPSTLGIVGTAFTLSSLGFNNGSSTAMWGLPGNAAWAANSPAFNVEKLRGKAIYVGAATGISGEIDNTPNNTRPSTTEQAAYVCSSYFVDQAKKAGVDVTWDHMVEGAHSWGLFEQELYRSWPVLAPAMGLPAE